MFTLAAVKGAAVLAVLLVSLMCEVCRLLSADAPLHFALKTAQQLYTTVWVRHAPRGGQLSSDAVWTMGWGVRDLSASSCKCVEHFIPASAFGMLSTLFYESSPCHMPLKLPMRGWLDVVHWLLYV